MDRELRRLLDAARDAARAASDLLRTARPADIRSKTDPKDLVTEWDLRSEQAIRDVLARHVPEVPVLGEEAGWTGEDRSSDLRWVVDPIDGTVNFAHGLPIWSVAIAAERDGRAVVGVVAAPALGWWFEAATGHGAFTNGGERLAVSATSALDHALLVTGFPYDRATSPDNNFAEWEHFQRTAGACRRLGCASIDLCLVARGWMDGYWERKLKPWDVSAGALIVKEAGGTVTNTHGGTFSSELGEVVASNGAIHEGLIRELGRVPRPARS
ncbi:MAG: inositol monophosphatase [Kofleriaceae bacterium]